jgi:2-iminobutanoate/2-iminopropanoate deaminase
MTDTPVKHPRRRTRRAVVTAGLATLAGTAANATAIPSEAATQPPPGAASAWTPKKAVIQRPGQKVPNPLLSACIRSGHLLFVSGIGGWYPDRRKEPGDAKVQIQSALATMKDILEAAGSSMANVLKVHMTVADAPKNLALLNEGYLGHFPDPPPARSYTGTSAELMGRPGELLQVDCVAYVD